MKPRKETLKARATELVRDTVGLEPRVACAALAAALAAIGLAAFWFVRSAPPRTLTLSSGPEGSSAQRNAGRYAEILGRSGVSVRVLPSEGSLENLKRLCDPSVRVDVGFVQDGETVPGMDRLVSLGLLNHQPLLVFYRGRTASKLSDFRGRRISVGAEGSGTHVLSSQLLEANGISLRGYAAIKTMEAEDSMRELLAGRLDAVFLMGDSAPREVIARLLRSHGIRLFDFTQADAYARHFNALSRIDLPRGAVDFGAGIPREDIRLVGPGVELVARKNLDPSLQDLLLEAAHEIHSTPGLFRDRGDFPVLRQMDFPVSPVAVRYYKSGKSFFFRFLPFALASALNRLLISFLPLAVVLIPILRSVPAVYRWRINAKIIRWYRELLKLEEDMAGRLSKEELPKLRARMATIEDAVSALSLPAPFAGQLYELRGHVLSVRSRLFPDAG